MNLSLDAGLSPDGSSAVRLSPARAGAALLTARVLINGMLAVAAGRTGIPEASLDPPGAVRVRVMNLVEDLPEDLAASSPASL